MTKLPYSRLETTGDNAVDATRLRVSFSDLRTIEQALIDAGSSGGGGADLGVEFRTITALENTNKELTLAETPGASNKVVVFIVEGSTQYFGVDYTVTGDILSWDTLGMDGIVEEGTRLVLIYPKDPGTPQPVGGELTRAELFETDGVSTIAGNSYVDLAFTPTSAESVRSYIIGGATQVNDLLDPGNGDFEIIDDDLLSPKRFSWDNLGMEAQLSSIGTKFLVVYTISTASAPEAVNVQTEPFTGNLSGATEVQGALDIVDALDLNSGAGSIPKVEYFVTDGVGTVNTQKYLDLASTPSDPSAVKVIVVGGSYQLNAELNNPGSYEITLDNSSNLRRINWNGFSMESALNSAGIYIAVEYYINQATATQASDILTSPFTGFLSGNVDVQEALNTIDTSFIPGGSFVGGSRLTVDPAHPSAADDGNKSTPFATIQAAVNAALAGDELFIASNGNTVYTENITIANKTLHLVGSGNAITGLGTYIEGTMTITGTGGLSLSHLYLSNYNTPAFAVLDFQSSSYLAIDGCYIDYTGTAYSIEFNGAEMYVYDSWLTAGATDLLLFNGQSSGVSHIKNSELSGRIELQDGKLSLMNCREAGDTYYQSNHATNTTELNINSVVINAPATQAPFSNISAGTFNLNIREVNLEGASSAWLKNTGGGTLNVSHQSIHVSSNLTDPADPGITLSSDRLAGFLTLDQDPTANLHAVTKQYADNKVRDQIQDGVTSSAPSENAVFDALALKQDAPAAGFKIQSGKINTGSSNANNTVNVVFPEAFSTSPVIVLTLDSNGESDTEVRLDSSSVTGFTATAYNIASSGGSTPHPLHWVAMGV